ncbi:MAG: EthD domain-containing protein [Luminiphilus sp.]|jgi:hypothetical protein|nr:EthD domain-containing protein [Luminiphilus sp.]MDC0572867.1 EthD domain-containing protein [Luminiphilus sp.]MDG2134695.1 EthD domain-containing protein [Luminiphilus sp.]
MIKLVTLLTKRPGMSREAFIEHYETHHKKIGEKYLAGYAVKYQRRYLQVADSANHAPQELPFDVLMEIWFPDQSRMDAAMALIASEAAQEEIVADEARLFDRELIRSYVVEEYESEMP